jgi:hypothetical protein
MDADLVLFLALSSFAIAIAGATAFVIFWPLWWLLHGDYRAAQDPCLSGLATPSRVSLLVILGGIAMGGLLWLLAGVLQ